MISLAGAEVHLWRIRLAPCSDELLSEDERARARRFRFPLHRERFVAARSALRRILAAYLDLDPAGLRFQYSPHGKPRLEQEWLRFNLAHSEDLALCAVAHGREVGVDIERIRPRPDEGIPERFFSPSEAAQLRGLPPPAFYRYWTAKEAWLKARGEGLSVALDSFDVSALNDPRWRCAWLLLGAAYAGALVVESPLHRLILSDLERPLRSPVSLPAPAE
jgi:4'-phosphopantetheinyl transferase